MISQHTTSRQIDFLSNEIGAMQEEKGMLERRLSYFHGGDWNNQAARELCADLDQLDQSIDEYETEIRLLTAQQMTTYL